jgi:uncharacterized protein
LGVDAAHAAPPAESVSVQHPSFSCVTPTALEMLICADPVLADDDRRMAVLYAAARAGALGDGGSQVEHTQRAWLKSRNAACASGDVSSCLSKEYDARLTELAVAALFQTPGAALAELKRQNQAAFPLYEAIYRYATLDEPARSQTVAPLIAPIFDTIHNKPWATPLRDIADAESAAASDHAFTTVLDVVSVSDYTVTLPCAAIVHRPGLIDALDSLYGGAIDGRLIQSDCDSTLPATPKLDHLLAEVVSAQSFCTGTIRFSLGRNYGMTLVKVRLHRLDILPEVTLPNRAKVANAQFRSEHTVQMQDATDELAHYYSTHFAVSEIVAHDDATTAINAVIGGAFDLCESDGG